MLDALNLIVEELVREDLTAEERNSLGAEIVKNSCLVESLRNDSSFDFSFIDIQCGQSQPHVMI